VERDRCLLEGRKQCLEAFRSHASPVPSSPEW
jgi:hypothetical protein